MWIALLMGLLTCPLAGIAQVSTQISSSPPAQTIPHFQLFRYNGQAFTDRDLPKGKMIFFMFIDPDCDHCQNAIKNVGEQFKAFRNTAVYLVCVYGKQKMDQFLNTYGAKVKSQKNVTLLHDKLGEFMKDFNPVRYPAMFLYSPERKLLDYEDNPLSVFRLVNTINQNAR